MWEMRIMTILPFVFFSLSFFIFLDGKMESGGALVCVL